MMFLENVNISVQENEKILLRRLQELLNSIKNKKNLHQRDLSSFSNEPFKYFHFPLLALSIRVKPRQERGNEFFFIKPSSWLTSKYTYEERLFSPFRLQSFERAITKVS